MQYTQDDHMNLFFNEELNQQIKALLVNNYLQPLSKNLEDVRMKINVSLQSCQVDISKLRNFSLYIRTVISFRNL